jgi:transposase InsO family protein
MNSVGSYYENAPVESFLGTLKNELVHHTVYDTRQEARTDHLFYIREGPQDFYLL